MKKLIYLMILGLISISCSNDDGTTTYAGGGFSNTPDAKAQYDNSNYGIYKGVFVGSTGYITININNNNSLSANLIINGITYYCSTSESVTLDASITGLTFTYGSSSFDFNVASNGDNPTITNISIAGHPNASMTVFKEHSTSQVKCYTGTYSGDDAGTLNVAITASGNIIGLAKSTAFEGTISLSGSLTASSIAGTFVNGTFTGTLSGNDISGLWQNTSSETGTWTCSRVL